MKQVYKSQGKYFDRITGNEYQGQLKKDLNIEDRYEEKDNQGQMRLHEIKDKQVLDSGHVIVVTADVGEVI